MALAGLTAGAIVTEAGLGWLESSLQKALANRQVDTSINGGEHFEQVVGANGTGYRAIDHVIPEPNGKVSVVSLGSRSDTIEMTDDEFLRKTEQTVMEKASKISSQRGYKNQNGTFLPGTQVAGRIVAVAIPETRAHLMNDARMTALLTRVHQAVSNVRSTTMVFRGWRPGRK